VTAPPPRKPPPPGERENGTLREAVLQQVLPKKRKCLMFYPVGREERGRPAGRLNEIWTGTASRRRRGISNEANPDIPQEGETMNVLL